MSGYDPRRRHPRGHRRVDRGGSEHFEADGADAQECDQRPQANRDRDDDQRILSELPPHWGVFSERA
ncbi:hypothetical protein WM015_06145 [Bifidobacterium mongoliense]|uniref:hypothetical protein n=1 Tax=Bifidobacterium mongoliense TaxID=518643 RepID=UPI000F4CDD6A|nr:hypothetical protein [Bifidobacterium mongoliense]